MRSNFTIILFVGLTGVGKSELARQLQRVVGYDILHDFFANGQTIPTEEAQQAAIQETLQFVLKRKMQGVGGVIIDSIQSPEFLTAIVQRFANDNVVVIHVDAIDTVRISNILDEELACREPRFASFEGAWREICRRDARKETFGIHNVMCRRDIHFVNHFDSSRQAAKELVQSLRRRAATPALQRAA